MRLDSARLVPVLVEFSSEDREAGWGRLLELGASSARLLTRIHLAHGERIALSFDLPGEAVGGLPAEVRRVRRDAEGYWAAELLFPPGQTRLKLGRALLRLATRTGQA